jgi:ligand-binding sensor domain-containing protein/serine phosphatase RsbU (regulator of sigma subunit)
LTHILNKIPALFICISLCINNYCYTQNNNIKTLSSKNGLNGSTVTSIYQDQKGIIWIGTEEGGLNRFDGHSFTCYTKKNGLPGNLVKAICEDSSGNIWLSLNELGAARFDGKKFSLFSDKNGLSNNKVYSIYKDSKNNIWFCTDSGLTRFDGKTFTYITTKNGLPSNKVFCMLEDHSGFFWFGTRKNLCRYDGKEIKVFTKQDGLSDDAIYCLEEDKKGNLWIGTVFKGVSIYDGKTFRPFKIAPDIDNALILDICQDRHDNIWIASDQEGLIKYSQKQISRITDANGLASNFIPAICNDYEGKLWIGTAGGGVNILNSEAIVTYGEKDRLLSNSIFTITGDHTNDFLVLTEKGINILKDNTIIKLDKIKEVNEATVITAAFDHKKGLWLGTRDNGLLHLEAAGDSYKLKKSLTKSADASLTKSITKIIVTKNNEIVVAYYGSGIIISKNDSTVHFSSKDQLPSDNILSLYQDKKGTIWIGTFQNGLVKYDGKTFKTYKDVDGLAGNTVQTIAEDLSGNLFFGSDEDGITILSGDKFIPVNVKNGLCSDNITSLYFDSYTNLWVGTNKGVNMVTFDDKFNIKTNKYFGEQQGLKSIEIPTDGIIQDKEGLIWICTNEGLVRYNPKLDYINNAPPKLLLNNIKLLYQDLDTTKLGLHIDSKTGLPANLVLPHNKSQLTFYFQALSIDVVRYSHILEGQDNDWSPLSTENYVTYSNINPGTYTFKVKAINSDGYWSDKIIEYTFTINPPWYKTWWFYTLAIIAIIGGTIGFVQFKTKQLQKQKMLLEEKVTERTVELKDSNDKLSVALTDISDSINYAKRIQTAILPVTQEFKQLLPDSFILFYPRNVVSGDFYWFLDREDKLFVAAVDCTGHGVPGAFMSMIGTSLLNEIAKQSSISNAAEVLDQLNVHLRKALKQDRESFESKDGMDLSVCVINKKTLTVDYAGAKRPIFLAKKNDNYQLQQIKGDRYSIGGMQIDKDFRFTNHSLQLKKGDRFYIFSDGFVDQFGGEHGKKLTTKRFEQHLSLIQSKPISTHQTELSNLLIGWQGNNEQVDDILVIGIEL